MPAFLSDDFLLYSDAAIRLYNDFARPMPIFDYHCHLPVKDIREDTRFANLTRIWLDGDHYKWRAMRANGIDENAITGNASDLEKFVAWAQTVPKTLRNPLYHWTHLELKRHFGIERLLDGKTAADIYHACSEMLQGKDLSVRGILNKMNVRVICTTDDPTDDLKHHANIARDKTFDVRVVPAFRPDAAMAVENPAGFNDWIMRLEAASDTAVDSYSRFLEALEQRHCFFHDAGCRLSDHGLQQPYAETFSTAEIPQIFDRVRRMQPLDAIDIFKFKSAMMQTLAEMDAGRNWTQQFHFGALRNTNTRAFETLGPDSGYDSMGDFDMAKPLARFLDTLDRNQRLAKTILYVLNPRDNELIAAMCGNFQDGTVVGKIQFGSAWWFNDQKDGIERQLDALSNMGLLSRFVGMLTDSRSFLSYPRHEYFRRVLCNLLGTDVENGELPDDFDLIGGMVQDVCYRNAVAYFGIETDPFPS
ncbi:MAG: glucuronate isomerase [Desulfobacterales bacterium]|nr:glucuronate isomerase [Desulfobacterales bacterium]